MDSALVVEAITTNLWWFSIGLVFVTGLISASVTTFFWLGIIKIRGK